MFKTIGVRPQFSFVYRSIKRDAMIFDALACVDVESVIRRLSFGGSEPLISTARDMEWLAREGILIDLDSGLDSAVKSDSRHAELLNTHTNLCDHLNASFARLHRAYSQSEGELDRNRFGQTMDRVVDEMLNVDAGLDAIDNYMARIKSVQLSQNSEIVAYPIIDDLFVLPQAARCTSADVLSIVIEALPQPDDSVPWERIVEFREDEEYRRKLLALRSWIGEASRSKRTTKELAEEIEYLLSEYRHYMDIQRIKYNAGTMETIVVTAAETLENALKLNLKDISKGFFSMRHRRVALLEAEVSAPGRRLSLIADARQFFDV